MPENRTTTIIPALPGWYVARLLRCSGEKDAEWADHFHLDPIVAWEIVREDWSRHPHHEVMPLTPMANMEHIGNDWAIKTPDEVHDGNLAIATTSPAPVAANP